MFVVDPASIAALRAGKIAEGMDPDQAKTLPKRHFFKEPTPDATNPAPPRARDSATDGL